MVSVSAMTAWPRGTALHLLFLTLKSLNFFPVVSKEGTEGMVYTKHRTKQMKVTISLSHIARAFRHLSPVKKKRKKKDGDKSSEKGASPLD